MEKITIIIDSLQKGGAEKMGVELAVLLSNHHNVYVFVLNGRNPKLDLLNKLTKAGVPYFLNTKNMFVMSVLLYRHFIENRTEVVFSYLLRGNFFGGIIGKIAGINRIYGGIRSSRIDFWKLPLQRFLHRHIHTCTISNNYASLDFLHNKKFNLNKIKVIQNFIREEEFHIKEKNKLNTTELKIITVARFISAKDIETSLKAIKHLRKKITNFHYLIIGWGELENQIRSYITSNLIEDFVSLEINPENLNDFYQTSQIYLSTSITEGVSNSILEALSYGLPVVATDVGDNKYMVVDNFNGFLHPVKDFEGISASLYRLSKDSNIREEFSRNAINHVRMNFSEANYLEKYLTLINGQ